MAATLPMYYASLNWSRYSLVYFSDLDLKGYKHWARKHPEYFARTPSARRMPSDVQMRINIRANGRFRDELALYNVIKSSKSTVSLISREKAIASKGEFLPSTSSRDPSRDKILLRIRRPSCAASEDETFFVVEHCPGGHDAVLRHDLNLEQDESAHPIGLGPRTKSEREKQKRKDEEANERRKKEKEDEDRRYEEDYQRRQQSGKGKGRHAP